MSLRRAAAMARKEFLHILRDPRSMAMALAMPFVMLLLFGYALTLDVDQVPTLVRDSSRTSESRALLARFEGSRFFDVIGNTGDQADIDRMIDSGEIMVAIVIPPNYARDLADGGTADVQVLIDGSDSNTANIALGYVNAVFQTYNGNLRAEAQNRRFGRTVPLPVSPEARVLYNHTLESKNFIVPGLIAVILMIIAALLTSLTIAREWEMGTMEQVLSTPLRPAEIVLGKMTAYFALGVIDTVVAIVVAVTIFSVPFRGNLILLAAACCVFLVGALFWGIMISAAARSQLLAYQMGMMTSYLPAFLLSGFIYSIDNMPLPIQWITYIVPARYFITIMKALFLKGVGLQILAGDFLFLAVYAVVVFTFATRKMRQKVA